MTTKIKPFTTGTLTARWAHLHAPDVKFGEDAANHSITIIVDDELQEQLDAMLKEADASKINGMREDPEGFSTLKAKSKTYVKRGEQTFPCRDAKAQPTTVTPFGGDKVRLRLSPVKLTRDGSLSLFLNGCQIIERNQVDQGTGGFEPTEGFEDPGLSAPPVDETDVNATNTDEIPF
jgi:hypothetical protein